MIFHKRSLLSADCWGSASPSTTLLGIIIVGLLTTGKNKNREKYGEIAQNPPHYPGRNFTSAKPFNFKIAEITKITEI